MVRSDFEPRHLFYKDGIHRPDRRGIHVFLELVRLTRALRECDRRDYRNQNQADENRIEL
jgi:hypothetical protein